MHKKFHPLVVISFLTGFSLMAYELAAARLLAPILGSSIYVWTSVIGVIIAALSLGYWLGGKLADARQSRIDVAILCLIAAACVVATMFAHTSILPSIANSIEDVRLQGVVASLLLFSPTSFFLGCISPYLAKLNIKALETAGESVANISALNSIGGIVGTFTTGFILFGYLGSNETLSIVVILLVISSWLLVPRQYLTPRLITSALLIGLTLIPVQVPHTLASIDTPSAHYSIVQATYNQEPIYGLMTGPSGIQSAVYTEGRDDLVFWYTQYAEQLITNEEPDKVLVLGGGAFTLPRALSKALPNSTIDVVEIDSELETISKQYFNYKDASNINFFFEDARTYVNTAKIKYDAIFVDVYGDTSVPFSLLTKEYGERINALLAPEGIVVINAIAGMQGACYELLTAIDSVYRPFLPNAFWQTQSGFPQVRSNLILLYTKNEKPSLRMNVLEKPGNSTLYTDNYTPAERLQYQCQQEG